jgi:hypothetical protein
MHRGFEDRQATIVPAFAPDVPRDFLDFIGCPSGLCGHSSSAPSGFLVPPERHCASEVPPRSMGSQQTGEIHGVSRGSVRLEQVETGGMGYYLPKESWLIANCELRDPNLGGTAVNS